MKNNESLTSKLSDSRGETPGTQLGQSSYSESRPQNNPAVRFSAIVRRLFHGIGLILSPFVCHILSTQKDYMLGRMQTKMSLHEEWKNAKILLQNQQRKSAQK